MPIFEKYLLLKPLMLPLVIFFLAGLFFIYRALKTKKDKSLLMLGRKNMHQWNKPYIEKNKDNIKRWVTLDLTLGIIFILIVLCILAGIFLGNN
jgi:hypothetical protein